jgi:ribonuclease HII
MDKNSGSLFSYETSQDAPICGIDEAGRGPIAGSLVYAGVVLNNKIDELNDSKKLSAKKREILYQKIIENSNYFIFEADATKIDTFGLSYCIKEALLAIKGHFGKNVTYIFDGNSSFGVDGINTLIKADQKIEAVSAASILAKVYRDNQMKDYAKVYPNYGFEKHKGYGTKAHLEAIAKYGYCDIHRTSFKIKLPNNKALF